MQKQLGKRKLSIYIYSGIYKLDVPINEDHENITLVSLLLLIKNKHDSLRELQMVYFQSNSGRLPLIVIKMR